MAKQLFIPKFNFVLADKGTGRFPKIDNTLISQRQLTSSLAETHIFDDRDNQEFKIKYYNSLYKGIAEFEVYLF